MNEGIHLDLDTWSMHTRDPNCKPRAVMLFNMSTYKLHENSRFRNHKSLLNTQLHETYTANPEMQTCKHYP